MLSYDGSKVFTAGSGKFKNRYNPRGRGNRGGRTGDRRDNQDGKPNRNGKNKTKNGSSVSV